LLRSAAIACSVFSVATALYWGSLDNGFHYDDYHSVVRNPHIRSIENLPRFFLDPSAFSEAAGNAMYRPVLLATYALNVSASGLSAREFHLINVLLHGLNAGLVFLFLRQLVRENMAAGGALLFAIHPLNSEAVNYVSSRSELLMATFLLLACVLYLRFRTVGAARWYLAAVAAAALSLLTKSVGGIAVFSFMSCDWLQKGWDGIRTQWRHYLGFLALPAAYLLFTRSIVEKAVLTPVRSLDVQLWTQLKALVFYALTCVVPVNLSVDPQFSLSRRVDDPVVLCVWLLIVSLAIVVMRHSRLFAFPWLWAVIALLPAMVVPLIVLVNEHRMYVAGIGFCLAAMWAFARMNARRPEVAKVVAGLYLLALASLTVGRNEVWADELELWDDAARKGPKMLKPQLRLGDAHAKLAQWSEAESAYLKALTLRPRHPAARNNLGRLYLRLGKLEKAEVQFRTLLDVSPDIVAARLNLAGVLVRHGHWQEAAQEYHRVLKFDAANSDALEHLGDIALRHGRNPTEALVFYRASVEASSDPSASLWSRLGVAAKEGNNLAEAEEAYSRALALDSTYADAWFNLGNLQVVQKRLKEASSSYRSAARYSRDPELARSARLRAEEISATTKF
jgi:tetratricopeptide (TPR) repeat protein